MSAEVAIGLGSNLGDRLANLRRGIAALRGVLADLVASPVYETEPWHLEGQPRFLNACCTGRTELEPTPLLRWLQSIEREAGRPPGGTRYGPRVLDLDLLLYGERVIRAPGLRVPHPGLTERPFVLVPLSDIAGGWTDPESGRTVGELAAAVSNAGVERYEGTIEGGES